MSRQANPTAIGTFVLVAGILTVGLSIFFGSMQLFATQKTFVLYFQESVNGLNVGSLVKFKGVPVGRVSDIRIRYDQAEQSDAVPVFIELDIDRIRRAGVEVDLTDPEQVFLTIDLGLRAELVLESLITGLLYIELDYVENPGTPNFIGQTDEILEIPTNKSPFAELGQTANQMLANLASIDYAGIASDLERLLETTNTRLAEVDLRRISNNFAQVLESVNELIASPEVKTLLTSVTDASDEFASLSRSLQGQVEPLAVELEATLVEARAAMAAFENFSDTTSEILAGNSAFRYQLEDMLTEITAAAESVRLLADLLERNPSALLSGKGTAP